MAKFGRITGLVNNAGTTKFVDHANLAGLSEQDFHDIYHLNVIAPFMMSRACEPHMRAGGRGSVVNISSVAGVMGVGSSIAYAASKGALNTMTLSLARVLGPEIRVNTVCPGFVIGEWLKQGMGEARYEATRENLAKNTALKKPGGSPEEMAEPVVWFLYGTSHTTGEFLMADGGMHLGQAPLTKRWARPARRCGSERPVRSAGKSWSRARRRAGLIAGRSPWGDADTKDNMSVGGLTCPPPDTGRS